MAPLPSTNPDRSADGNPDEPRHALRAAVVDISAGAQLMIPDAGHRYVSVMIIDQDHYIQAVFHEPGEHDLAVEQFGTSFVLVACRDPG